MKATAIIHSQLLKSKMKGSSYSGLMHVTDWYPTLMNLATDGDWSGKTISGYDLDGVDMTKALTKGTSSSRDIIVHYHDGRSSVIQQGDYKLYTNYIDEPVTDALWIPLTYPLIPSHHIHFLFFTGLQTIVYFQRGRGLEIGLYYLLKSLLLFHGGCHGR